MQGSDLSEFFDYKNQFMKDILTSEEIVELLKSKGSPTEPRKLRYTQVFPCEYIPDTTDEGKTYICFDVDIQKALNKTFLVPQLNVWIFTHKSLINLPNGGGVRVDKICSEICKVVNGSRYYGLGQLGLQSVRRFAPATDYIGKSMTFLTTDYNHLYNPKQSIPSNRKDG